MRRLADVLLVVEAQDVKVGPDKVTFEGGMSFFQGSGKFPRRNLVGLFDRCEVRTGADKIEYFCSTKIAAIVIAAVTAVVAMFVIFGPPKRDLSLEARLAMSFGVWLWLFGASYLVCSFKMRRLLKKAMYRE